MVSVWKPKMSTRQRKWDDLIICEIMKIACWNWCLLLLLLCLSGIAVFVILRRQLSSFEQHFFVYSCTCLCVIRIIFDICFKFRLKVSNCGEGFNRLHWSQYLIDTLCYWFRKYERHSWSRWDLNSETEAFSGALMILLSSCFFFYISQWLFFCLPLCIHYFYLSPLSLFVSQFRSVYMLLSIFPIFPHSLCLSVMSSLYRHISISDSQCIIFSHLLIHSFSLSHFLLLLLSLSFTLYFYFSVSFYMHFFLSLSCSACLLLYLFLNLALSLSFSLYICFSFSYYVYNSHHSLPLPPLLREI